MPARRRSVSAPTSRRPGSAASGAGSAGAMGRLDGRRALVTGASSGIGAEAARLLAREGADVALERGIADGARELGGLDVVVVAAAAGAFGHFDEMPAEDFDRSVEVTFRGAVDTIRAVLAELERSQGTLVVIGSAVDAVAL